jgi:hypothetical protein
MSTAYEEVHMKVGEPTWTGVCPHCSASLYEFPLTGISPSGVRSMGTVIACSECDTPTMIVSRYLESLPDAEAEGTGA